MRRRLVAAFAIVALILLFARLDPGPLAAPVVGARPEPAVAPRAMSTSTTPMMPAPSTEAIAERAHAAVSRGEISSPTPTPGQPRELVFDDYYVQIPAEVREPARVLVVLHGMGGEGKSFAAAFKAHCNSKHWVLVAPTFPHIERLRAILQGLPAATGLQLAPRVALYGYSRGAQTAHRFALVYPEEVRALAVLSAGSYTLPEDSFPAEGAARPLLWPFGTANMAGLFGRSLDRKAFSAIRFWVGVGAADNDPNETAAAWDPYEGAGRARRAAAYVRALEGQGAGVQFRVEPNMGHGPTDTVRAAALDFIANQL